MTGEPYTNSGYWKYPRRFLRGLGILWWFWLLMLFFGGIHFLPILYTIVAIGVSFIGFLIFAIYKIGEQDERWRNL